MITNCGSSLQLSITLLNSGRSLSSYLLKSLGCTSEQQLLDLETCFELAPTPFMQRANNFICRGT